MFLVVALVLAVLWRRPWLFVLVLGAAAIADAVSYGLREWIGRERPPLVYPEPEPLVSVPHSGSFPSGHATIAFACATVIAWASPQLAVPAFFARGRDRVLARLRRRALAARRARRRDPRRAASLQLF